MAMFSTLIDGFVGENCISDQLNDCNDEYAVLKVAVDRSKHKDSNLWASMLLQTRVKF
jgi:hypothetical protein